MTAGHKHRIVRVTEGSLVHRVLRKPLWHTVNQQRVKDSPYPYGPCEVHLPVTAGQPCYYLSVLGILHRWTGLTLGVRK